MKFQALTAQEAICRRLWNEPIWLWSHGLFEAMIYQEAGKYQLFFTYRGVSFSQGRKKSYASLDIAIRRARGILAHVRRLIREHKLPNFEPKQYRNQMRHRGPNDIADSKRPNYLIVYPDIFPIKPADVNTRGLMETFGNSETEVSAYWLLKLAKERNSWASFTLADIEKIYHVKYKEDFLFNRLVDIGSGYSIHGGRYDIGGGWIYYDETVERYYFSVDFVLRCCWGMAKNQPQSFVDTFERLWYDRFKPGEVGCIFFDHKSSRNPFHEGRNQKLLMEMQRSQLQKVLHDATRLCGAIKDFCDAHWAKIVTVNAKTRTERAFTFTHPEVTLSSYCMAGRIMVTFGSTEPGGDQVSIVGSDDLDESRPGLQSIDWNFNDAIRCIEFATKYFNVASYVPDKGVTLDVLAGQ